MCAQNEEPQQALKGALSSARGRWLSTVRGMSRPLPKGAVIPVSGVSFRQDQVRNVLEGQGVELHHDFSNPYDQLAVRVETSEGVLLGYVPAKGGLAARLSSAHPGGVWSAVVTEVLRGETYGLRIKVGELVRTVDTTVGSNNKGLREVKEVDEASNEVPLEVVTAPAGPVHTVTGRYLGELVGADEKVVRVESEGLITAWPAGTVVTG